MDLPEDLHRDGLGRSELSLEFDDLLKIYATSRLLVSSDVPSFKCPLQQYL